MGNPGETEETVGATIGVATGIRPNLAMFFVATAYPGTPMYDQAVAEGNVEPRWWASQAWDPSKNSAFQARWGWTDKGALKIPGFDSENWQRKATRAFYLRPYFMWDTVVFTLKNPYFLRHLLTLGKELIPFYRMRNLLPVERTLSPKEKQGALAKCPCAPNVDLRRAHRGDGRTPAALIELGPGPPA